MALSPFAEVDGSIIAGYELENAVRPGGCLRIVIRRASRSRGASSAESGADPGRWQIRSRADDGDAGEHPLDAKRLLGLQHHVAKAFLSLRSFRLAMIMINAMPMRAVYR